MSTVVVTVDDDKLQAFIRRAESNLDRLVQEVAEETAQELASEAGKRSPRLGVPWEIDGSGDERRTITAPEWWAHFLSGGTVAHGPTSKSRMVFTIDGDTVWARSVSGIAADPFDERAARSAGSRVDEIVERLIGGL
jgi:hypothetical protein